MMKERYRNMMEQAVLSEGAKADLLEKLEQKHPARKGTRVLRAALIAACACVVLVGTAFAANAITGGVLVEFFRGEKVFGMVGNGYSVCYENAYSRPITDFSEEVRQIQGSPVRYFESWDEAEDYVGIELMNNAVLESAEKWHVFFIDEKSGDEIPVSCFAALSEAEGNLRAASVTAFFIVDRASGYPLYTRVDSTAYSEYSDFSPGEKGISYYYGEDAESSGELYATPKGLTAVIMTTYGDSWGIDGVHYSAHFSLNGAVFEVTVSCPFTGEDGAGRLTLQGILDAIEV